MEYFPVNLNIRGRNCIVIGGGRVALRKVRGLLECEGNVTVISPKIEQDLETLVQLKQIRWKERPYKTGDLREAFLVIAATDDPDIQESVYSEAEKSNVLINVADVPKYCNFILPANVRRGNLSLSVSTSGKSPALAKKLRQELERQFGSEYDVVLEILGRLRPVVLSMQRPHEENKILFEKLLHHDLIDWVRKENWSAIHTHAQSVLERDIPIDILFPGEKEVPQAD